MSNLIRTAARYPRLLPRLVAGLLLAFLILVSAPGYAQQLTGTVSGNVYDQTGALIPGAEIVIQNEASGDQRSVTADGQGHFVVTALQPASYTITVTATNFTTWKETGVVINQGDNRDVPNIKLNAGGSSTQVDVVSGADAQVPLDTAEVSTSLNTTMIDQFPLAGRDAGELLKIMPGMGINTGSSLSGFSGQTARLVGSNNGPVGDFSSNGTQPNSAMAYMLDGADLVDPGNDGTQIANINQDMTDSIKVLQSSYGAEYAKGPTIFAAYSKSGGSKFHGEAYLYTHNSIFDSVDAYTKSQGGTNADQHYYYYGGNIGGPVILPFTKFNRKRDSLFFWVGYEYMQQQPAGSIINYNVPNAAQLAGDFSNTNVGGNTSPTVNAFPAFYGPTLNRLPADAVGTTVPTSDFDPNITGIAALYPKTSQTPSPGNGYTNYSYSNTSPQNRYEITAKANYSLGDNTKITGSYTYQHENDLAPISIWWNPSNTLPYPSASASKTKSELIMINGTHVFSPTTTNEFVFTRAYFTNPYTFSNANAVSRGTNNFNLPGLFGQTSNQIPNFVTDCCSGQMGELNYYDLDRGYFGGIKTVPAIYDNFTKVLGNHAVKVGMYWDTQENSQPLNGPGNGAYDFSDGTFGTGSLPLNFLLGRISNYQQWNALPVEDIKWHQWSIYGQDQWKATRRLTLNIGLRADHMGNWYGLQNGFAVFDGTTYNNTAAAPNNTGLLYHSVDSSIPESGWPSRLFFYSPRVGFAYDIFGTGRTVFRGGIADFPYQVSTQIGDAGNITLGAYQYTTPTGFEGYAGLSNFTPSASSSLGTQIEAMQRNDDRNPYTTDWNATLSQAMPHHTVLEVSYVGNRSANEFMEGTNSNLYNLNNVAAGGFFQPNPRASSAYFGTQQSPAPPACQTDPTAQTEPLACLTYNYNVNFTANDYRPLANYTNVYLITHAGYSHYNGAQVSFQKQSGAITFVTNYTFSKVLGTRDGVSNNGGGNGTTVDPFNIRNNYGPLEYDHTHIVNLVYSWNLPKPIHNNRILEGAINGWQLSGYTAFQSGAPLQPYLNGTLNANFPSALTVPTVAHPELPDNSITLPNGLKAIAVNGSTWFGSNAYNVVVPQITCDPRKGLGHNMRFNPACFAPPAYGQQGTLIWPYLRLPNYFDTDLGVYKNFQITERQKLSIRAYATNWLNHAQPQFGLASQADEQLNFIQSGALNGVTTQALATTNQNAATTGRPAFETGQRQVTLSAKYFF